MLVRTFWIAMFGASVAGAVFVHPASPRVDDLPRVESEFVGSAEKATAAFDDAIFKAAEKVVRSFDAAIKAAMTDGDLDAAVRLRDRRERYAAMMSRRNIWQPISGTYSAKHADWPKALDLVMRPDGTFSVPSWGRDERIDGTWEVSTAGQAVTLNWTKFPADRMLPSMRFQTDKLSLTWKSYAVDQK